MSEWKDELVKQYPGILKAPHWRTGNLEPVPLCVGDGWRCCLEQLVPKLNTIWRSLPAEEQDAIYVVQVKEKFGGLRFYMSRHNEEMAKEIQLAEMESMRTCEACGNPGSLRRDRSWWATLCDACNSKTSGGE